MLKMFWVVFVWIYNFSDGEATLVVSPWQMEKKIKAVAHVALVKQGMCALQQLSMSGILNMQQNRRIPKIILLWLLGLKPRTRFNL